MAAADDAKGGGRRDWRRRESFLSAVLQVALVGVLLAGAVAFYVQRQHARRAVTEKLREARAVALRDNPADLRKALALVEQALEAHDSHPDALALAADLHTELWLAHREPGAEARARDLLARAVAADARSEERYATEALHKLAAGDAAGAEAFVEELRQQGANSARLLYVAGLAHQQLGRLALAREAFRRAHEQAWRDPRYSLAMAELLLEEDQQLRAAEMLNQALKASGDHLRARLDLALVSAWRGARLPQAVETVRDVLARPDGELSPPLRARALTVQAELALAEGKPEAALAAAEAALKQDAQEAYALYARARALAARGDPSAPKAFQDAVTRRRTAPVLYFGGAEALVRAGQLEGARALLDGYEATFKDVRLATTTGEEEAYLQRDDRYWLARGDLLRNAGDLDGALGAYDRAIAAKSLNQPRAHYAKGALYLSRNELARAKESLTLVTPPDGSGSVPEAYLAMGELLFQERDFAAGCQHYGFALTRLRAQGAPLQRLESIIEEVDRKLVGAGQAQLAGVWRKESRALLH